MRFVLVAVLAGIALAPLVSGQKLDLKFDGLAAKASQKAEVDLDGSILKLAMPQMLAKKEKEKQKDGKSPMADLLNGVQEIHVRHYEFDKEGAYSDTDLESLHNQVSQGPGWSRIVNVKEKGQNVEVFVQTVGDKVTSCLVLAAEAKELNVVYLMGTLTVAQMKELVDSNVADNLASLMENPSM